MPPTWTSRAKRKSATPAIASTVVRAATFTCRPLEADLSGVPLPAGRVSPPACRTATTRVPRASPLGGRWRASAVSDPGLLGNSEGVIDLDGKVPHGRRERGVPKRPDALPEQ